MTADPDPALEGDPEVVERRWRFTRPAFAMVVCIVAVLVVVAAGLVGYNLAGERPPGENSPEAGFARDMQTHHAQAVEMALLVREKSADPVLRAVAYDVITGQQQQIGQMFAWLRLWALPQTSNQPSLGWMRGMDHGTKRDGTLPGDSAPIPAGRMPGMASASQLDELAAASGKQAEVLWLRLMISHHRAGVAMGNTIQQQTDRTEVLQLAGSIVVAQRAEIDQMLMLLDARGAR